MADDMGYECLGAYGCASYSTPNLDRMAEDGVRFDHCYSTPICSPSRVQIMTGRYNNRNYTQWGTLPRTEKTFGHMLNDAGYATACAGKWQLSSDGVTPKKAGFEESCMWAYGFDLEGFELKHEKGAENNYYFNPAEPEERYYCVVDDRPHMTSRYWRPCALWNGKLVPATWDNYGPDICSDFVVDFIGRHKEGPFFVYYPMILTHGPNVPTPESPGVDEMTPEKKLKSSKENFKYMVEHADIIVGRILAKLDDLGIRENTLVLFTGDNGTQKGTETTMKDGSVVIGGKGATTNGGTHVPLIANWKGTAAAGAVCDDLVDFTDVLPTLADAAGAAPPKGVSLDGRSFLSQVRGRKGNPRDWVFCHYDKNPASAMANPKFPRARFARDKRYKLYDNGRVYDLDADPLEEKPISAIPERSSAEQARTTLQKVLDSMYVKEDFYTQGGVTRENNLAKPFLNIE